jgi:large subunit ribosomal protein L6
MNTNKKYIIQIPKNINVLYCNKKKIVTFVGLLQKKSLKLEVKILLLPSTNSIIITNLQFNKTSNSNLKNIKSIQGTTAAKIKQIIIEISYTLYHKLNFVGLGYRVFPLENFNNQIYFKLGFSHLIYFKIPNSVNTFCKRFTKLFIYGNSSLSDIMKTASLIQHCKKPEPYKGKGIIHEGEKILLKKGKKI